MELIFVGSIFLILFAYVGYPFSLCLLGFFIHRRVQRAPIFPGVTLIITAFNEEKRIKEKLDDTLALEYPREKLQIIVASDGSVDRTNEITRGYYMNGVELLEILDRKGKENAQREAVKQAKGDVIVFTDVATMLDPEGLKQIVSNFADPSVGCVSSEDRLLGKDGNPSGEGSYVRYEMWLRRLESKANCLVGLSGSFFAARREVCQDFSDEMDSDFRTVLSSTRLGFRGVSDPHAIGYYQDVADEKHEFDRKIRTVLRGITVFFRHLEFLNVMKYKIFSYQYFCHKLLRWLVPAFMLMVFASNVMLASRSLLFMVSLLGQISFYCIGILAWRIRFFCSLRLVKLLTYFVVANVSILVGWWKYLTGHRIVMWTPSER